MNPWLKYAALGVRSCAATVGSFALWTLWLGLLLLFAAQVVIVSSQELAVPSFLLRRVERQLAGAGLTVTFGRTSFDPLGRILVEDVRLSLPAFPDPVVTARAVFVRLNPRALLALSLEPAEIQIMHATVFAPAQLSPSGRNEEIISALEATATLRGRELDLQQASGRLANLTIAARGHVRLPAAGTQPPDRWSFDRAVREFPSLCRQMIALEAQLARCGEPALDLEIGSLADGAPTLAITALARQISVDGPVAAEADDVVGTLRVLLREHPIVSPIAITAGAVRVAHRATADGLDALLIGKLRSGPLAFDLREAILTVDHLTAEGVPAQAVSARLTALPLPGLEADITARLLGAPLSLQGSTDLAAHSARVRFAGAISPQVLDVVSRYVGTDVRRFYEFDSLEAESGDVRFGPGWKFEKLTARVKVPRMNSYGVIMEDGRATVELEPGRFYSPEAFARVGDYFAHGTYEHNLRTHEFRFLLAGQLRPLAISRWFGPWWPNFFEHLEFSAAPPDASVDVSGFWRQGRRTSVFVFADTPQVIIRGTKLEHTRTRLFIRPGWFDGLEVLATRDGSETTGTFAYRLNAAYEWDTLDLDLESTFDLPLIAELLGPTGASSLRPYRLGTAPDLKVHGTLRGPGSPHPEDDTLQIEARTTGEFRFHEFPLQDVSFSAVLKGNDVTIDRFNGSFASGSASGNARVWGAGEARRVGFNVALENAHLGQAASTLQAFLALKRGQPPPPPGKFVQERADLILNVAASAEGAYDNPFSYHGDGNATLQGLGIGQVPLLGLLSELFTFTSLRFTEARGNFKIAGPKLIFPKIELRGANSAIDAQGDFSIERSELKFTAKVFPFHESGNVLKSVVGAVLTPLSNALEVKLSGTLEKPQWAFVMGPANLLRSLAEGAAAAPQPGVPPPPAAPAAPAAPSEIAPPAPTSPADSRPVKPGSEP